MCKKSVVSKFITILIVASLWAGLLPARQAQAQTGAVQSPYIGMWITASELAALPTSGTAWTALLKAANASPGTPDVQNQDSDNDVYVLAKALVFARTGDTRYRAEVIDNLKRAVGTEKGGRTLALARNLVSYVISADLVNLPKADPAFDSTFRAWLRVTLTETLDGRTLVSTHEERPNNWGTHAGASRTAVALYLGDRAQLDRAALVMKGWLGDWNAYHAFSYGELDWQCDPAKPLGINPKGCTKNGKSIDGAQGEEMRRGGTFQFPPVVTGYPWEALQGTVVQATLLQRAGYPAFSWSDNAILRAVNFLYSINWPATGDDLFEVWLINYAYGTSIPAKSPVGEGKNMGWTDWTHQKKTAAAPQPTAAPVQPTATPVQPTATPVKPTATPAQPTATPAQPTATPAQPTATPVQQTGKPGKATATPAQPTATPIQPTTAPAQPSATPIQPTTAPVQPTTAPAAPTPVPQLPAGGVIKLMTFENNNLNDPSTGADRVSGDVRLTGSPYALRGSYSAHFASASSSYLQEDFIATADLDVTLYLYINSLPGSDTRIVQISNSGTTTGNLVLRSSGTLRLRNDSNSLGESAPLVAGTVYQVRLHQTRAGVLEAFVIPAGGQFGGAFAAINNGAWGTDATFVRFGATASAVFDGRMDDILITGR